MLITDKKRLTDYYSGNRLWEGIPAIERTAGGRIFTAFYSGMIGEALGNYVVLLQSDDDGATFSEPVAVADIGRNARCFDPCLWIDPLGRLWFFWAVSPETAVYATVCAHPDNERLQWSAPQKIATGVMMNKPIVLQTGEWLLPVAVWKGKYARHIATSPDISDENRKAYVYQSCDNGASFRRLGGVDMPRRSFDENVLLENKSGYLTMFIRTECGIGAAISYDGGLTWKIQGPKVMDGPCSRFHVRRLKSGRVLVVNHVDFTGRNNLCALLSEDDGKTFAYRLLLDERNGVSYPDAVESDDGYIYIVYDHGRGASKSSLESVEKCPREILMAKITEKDIMAGTITDSNSRLKCVVHALGKYTGPDKNPYHEKQRYTAEEYAAYLLTISYDEAINKIFSDFCFYCSDIQEVDRVYIDNAISKVLDTQTNDIEKKYWLTTLVKKMYQQHYGQPGKEDYSVERMLDYINTHYASGFTLDEMAAQLHISKFYMCHLFKKKTSLSLMQYRVYQQICIAKRKLTETEMPVKELSLVLGFCNEAYFVETFKQYTGITPQKYRRLH